MVPPPGTWPRTAACIALGLLGGRVPLAGQVSATRVDLGSCELEGVEETRTGECGQVSLPLDHDDPDGARIPIVVTRILPDGPVRQQLWFLDGGPGDAGRASLARVADALTAVEGLALYTLDHRGVGGSALLECPDQQDRESADGRELVSEEWGDCIEWLERNRDDLDHLSTTASAHDLSSLIEIFRLDDVPVFVMGASYGSFWANRYLQHHADQPDAVILDGIAPGDWTFAEFDASLDAMGRRLLHICSLDPTCGDRMGGDALAFTSSVMERMAAGHCRALGLDVPTYRLVLGNLLMGGRDLWPYIPVLTYRLDRCAIRDILVIAHFFEAVFESGEVGEPESHSPVLQRHVSMSELWPPAGPSVDALERALDGTVMTTGVSASFAATYEGWPRYPRPEAWNELAAYAGPMLLLHGGLDPTLSMDRLAAVRRQFSGPA